MNIHVQVLTQPFLTDSIPPLIDVFHLSITSLSHPVSEQVTNSRSNDTDT